MAFRQGKLQLQLQNHYDYMLSRELLVSPAPHLSNYCHKLKTSIIDTSWLLFRYEVFSSRWKDYDLVIDNLDVMRYNVILIGLETEWDILLA